MALKGNKKRLGHEYKKAEQEATDKALKASIHDHPNPEKVKKEAMYKASEDYLTDMEDDLELQETEEANRKKAKFSKLKKLLGK